MKNGLCESYANDRCGKCRAHLCSGCSKVCPISCNVSPLCENCEDPEKHQCFVLVIQKMQSQSQEHLAAVLAQHEQATRMADARLQTMGQMARDARQSEQQIRVEKADLESAAKAEYERLVAKKDQDLAKGEKDAEARYFSSLEAMNTDFGRRLA